MGARVVKLICTRCLKPFKAERKQARQPSACCSYECDRWRRHEATRKAAVANWRYLPNSTRRHHEQWLSRSL